MPSLRALEAYFIKYKLAIADKHIGRPMPDGTTQWGGFEQDSFEHCEFAEADGLMFLCPLCFKANGGPVRTHSMWAFFQGRNAPPHIGKNKAGATVRWAILPASTCLDDLQISPSIQIEGGCNWHGFIGYAGVPPGHAD